MTGIRPGSPSSRQAIPVADQSAYLQGCTDGAHQVLASYGYTVGSDGIARPPR